MLNARADARSQVVVRFLNIQIVSGDFGVCISTDETDVSWHLFLNISISLHISLYLIYIYICTSSYQYICIYLHLYEICRYNLQHFKSTSYSCIDMNILMIFTPHRYTLIHRSGPPHGTSPCSQVIGLLAFCGPGLFNALNGLGNVRKPKRKSTQMEAPSPPG